MVFHLYHLKLITKTEQIFSKKLAVIYLCTSKLFTIHNFYTYIDVSGLKLQFSNKNYGNKNYSIKQQICNIIFKTPQNIKKKRKPKTSVIFPNHIYVITHPYHYYN